MNESFAQNMPDILPFGIGYVKLIIDVQDKVTDYIYLDINRAFEELTGLRREEVLNKRISELSDEKRDGPVGFLLSCERIFRRGEMQETTQWIDAIGKYFKIMIIPKDRYSFVIIIRDAYEAHEVAFAEGTHPLFDAVGDVFNSTHDSLSLVEYSDQGFKYIKTNTIHKKQTGIREPGGLSPFEMYGQKTGEELSEHFLKCINTGCPVSCEEEFDFAPGKRIWQIDIIPVFGDRGIRCLLCAGKDVTELRKVQKERDLLAHRLQSTFEQHNAVMLVIDPSSGRIVDANPSACDFYGYTREELLGLNINRINMLPSDQVRDMYLRADEKKQNYFLFPHRLKSGEIRPVDVFSCPIDDGNSRLLSSIVFDVSDREEYRGELYREKELLRTTLQSVGDGVVTTNRDGNITGLNHAAQEITGWKDSEASGKSFSEVFVLRNEETGLAAENPIQTVLESGRIVGLANHTVLINRREQSIPIADSAAPIKSEDGRILGVVMVFRDVGNERAQNRQIRFLSYHDSLTGLHNRHYMEEAILAMDIVENLPLSIIMGDVNGLKITNDVFGHEAGDNLLQQVGGLFEKNRRKGDVIARWGGDEFVVLMPRTGPEDAESVIREIKGDNTAMDKSGLRVSLSLGCAVKETMERNIRAVLREAEGNMYQQKLLDGKSYRNAIINTLLATLYEKSTETEGHSKRMEAYCHFIGRKLGLSSKEMDELSLLAVLHDIGKVGINQDILKKPHALTKEEWSEVKRHPEIGYRIVQATPELANVADFILSHHERWDGTGYPRGLREKEIPLLCRIPQ